ncbi:glycosyltransferase family 2 protein [uncultured Cellulomonas sp.]|uniref:glycosyltransferase family 2 protein n=1 Tax=uncultured Cellulomonas sp. TaxID=189682 RepID=UPI002636665F|nr:glycosyltransferase family 2 protein [uncultured Cellulomonas sp.]
MSTAPQMRPDLAGTAVVVVNYGSSHLLAENLAGTDLGASGVPVVVVDNVTTPDERVRLRALAGTHGWTVVEMDRNVGFGAGMNAGVARARDAGHDVFLLLNPDASIPVAGLATLVDDVRREPLTLVTPTITHPDGSPWFRGAWVDVPHGRTRLSEGVADHPDDAWLAGTCLVVHADLWDAVGGFDDDYFLYWEDIDLSWRCRTAGGRLAVRSDVRAVHSVGGTQAATGKSPTYYYWNTRNRLLFAAQHLSRRDLLRWSVRTIPYARAVLLRGGRRQLLHPVAPVGAVVRGSLAGLAIAVRALAGRPVRPRTSRAAPGSAATAREGAPQ